MTCFVDPLPNKSQKTLSCLKSIGHFLKLGLISGVLSKEKAGSRVMFSILRPCQMHRRILALSGPSRRPLIKRMSIYHWITSFHRTGL